MKNKIYYGDNLLLLKELPSECIDLIYIDPPFNTGKVQQRVQIKTKRSKNGNRVGFQGERYETIKLSANSYRDSYENYLEFLKPRLVEAYRVLAPSGSLYFHIDYREVHYCKLLLDDIFGRECFINEIIWAYDYGARTRRRWPAKHDNILFYVKNTNDYYINTEEMEKIKFVSPSFIGGVSAQKIDTMTDTWWHTIVPTNGKEKTGYPTQKPIGLIKRIIQVSSRKNSTILDFFAGSGTTGAVAYDLGRNFILMDNNIMAMKVMAKRFRDLEVIEWVNYDI